MGSKPRTVTEKWKDILEILHLKYRHGYVTESYSACLAYMKPRVQSTASRKPGMLTHTCSASAVRRQTGKPEVQPHPWVYCKFKANLSYIRLYPKDKTQKQTTNKQKQEKILWLFPAIYHAIAFSDNRGLWKEMDIISPEKKYFGLVVVVATNLMTRRIQLIDILNWVINSLSAILVRVSAKWIYAVILRKQV